ncbi:MAG: glutathione S-transferase family protein [Deltaproteobacteria bacterium]|nr:glutathione S-transferase family protein [Deltaproteobacteria bacterium]
MLTLYTFQGAHGLYDVSPFVTKAATWLRMAGIEFTAKPGNPRQAPKGKIPYIDHDGTILGDSSLIIEHCREAFKVDLDEGLTARDKALARAAQSMLEEHMYFNALVLRWGDPRGWAVMKPFVMELAGTLGVPGFLRGLVAEQIRKGPLKNAWFQGAGRHAYPEVEHTACAIADAVSELLGDNQYFLGERPRTIDATVWAFVNTVRVFPIDNSVRARIAGHKNLVDYCARMEERFGPKR